jgi:transcriptional regulator
LIYIAVKYVGQNHVEAVLSNLALKKGSVELLLLSILEDEPRHGYEIGKLIEMRSGGRLRFRVSSLYPILCRMEDRGWIKGRWVEKAGERRRRFYSLTKKGVRALAEQRRTWDEFTLAVNLVLGLSHA